MQFHSFEEAKAFLQKTPASSSLSLYDHLSDVIQRVLRNPNDNAYDNIETISMLVKTERLNLQRTPEGFTFDSTPEICDAEIKAAKAILDLFPSPPDPEAEPAEPSSAVVSDVISEASLLQWAGVGLGEEDTYLLHLAVQRLSSQVPTATSIRYFGQFICMNGTYTVCEVSTPEQDETFPDPDSRFESHGKGANAFVYYVTTSRAFGTWIKLPAVLPEQICLSRVMKRLLTGDLDAAVRGSPHFRWNEAAYLRALIARISASTTIAPKGMFELKEEEEEGAGSTVVPAEEFQMPASSELASPDAWVHRSGALLKQGRIIPFVKEPSEEDPDAEKTENSSEPVEEEEAEEAIPPLRSISEDESAPWTIRSYSGPQNPIVTIRSLTWPGAITVIKGNTFVNIYVGDGQRQLSTIWQPALPLPFQSEFKDDSEEPKLKFEEDPLPPPKTESEPVAAEPEPDETEEAAPE